MNKNVIFIIVGAVLAAIIVSMAVRSAVKNPQDASSAVEVTEILVASNKISIGKEVKKEDVKWQKWPKDALFKGIIEKSKQKDVENLKIYGQKVRRTIEKGEPVTMGAVIKESAGRSFLAASLGEGMRAISIPVSAVSSAGGFIQPNDRVDVILTHSPKFKGDAKIYAETTVQRYASQTILSNIKVLAIDQKTKKNSNDDKVKPGKTATLEVDKKGAEILALAMKMGELSLSLRNLGDIEDNSNKNTRQNLTTDTEISDVIKAVINKQKKAAISTNVIRVYNGREAQDITVRDNK